MCSGRDARLRPTSRYRVVDAYSASASARYFCDTSLAWRDAPDLDDCRPTP